MLYGARRVDHIFFTRGQVHICHQSSQQRIGDVAYQIRAVIRAGVVHGDHVVHVIGHLGQLGTSLVDGNARLEQVDRVIIARADVIREPIRVVVHRDRVRQRVGVPGLYRAGRIDGAASACGQGSAAVRVGHIRVGSQQVAQQGVDDGAIDQIRAVIRTVVGDHDGVVHRIAYLGQGIPALINQYSRLEQVDLVASLCGLLVFARAVDHHHRIGQRIRVTREHCPGRLDDAGRPGGQGGATGGIGYIGVGGICQVAQNVIDNRIATQGDGTGIGNRDGIVHRVANLAQGIPGFLHLDSAQREGAQGQVLQLRPHFMGRAGVHQEAVEATDLVAEQVAEVEAGLEQRGFREIIALDSVGARWVGCPSRWRELRHEAPVIRRFGGAAWEGDLALLDGTQVHAAAGVVARKTIGAKGIRLVKHLAQAVFWRFQGAAIGHAGRLLRSIVADPFEHLHLHRTPAVGGFRHHEDVADGMQLAGLVGNTVVFIVDHTEAAISAGADVLLEQPGTDRRRSIGGEQRAEQIDQQLVLIISIEVFEIGCRAYR